MDSLIFNTSPKYTLGTELELQLLNPRHFSLAARAKDFLRRIKDSEFSENIKPEITQSMIEINSSVEHSANDLLISLRKINMFMREAANELNFCFSGGGTHPFQLWRHRKIFPAPRYRKLAKKHGYLAKRFTVFGQHVHIGCANGDQAIYLTHALARYIPQLIALSASSPFYQGVDTAFDSSRSNIVTAFPTSGHMPIAIKSWEEFRAYYQKLIDLQIIESIKDIYWDIRPKAETGTVEVRVFDTPLTIGKAVMLAAYVQTLARYVLNEKTEYPVNVSSYEQMIYDYNRFQASRYGFDGDFINPYTFEHSLIAQDILTTIKRIESHTNYLNNNKYLEQIYNSAATKSNDAKLVREMYSQEKALRKVVQKQSQLWMEEV